MAYIPFLAFCYRFFQLVAINNDDLFLTANMDTIFDIFTFLQLKQKFRTCGFIHTGG